MLACMQLSQAESEAQGWEGQDAWPGGVQAEARPRPSGQQQQAHRAARQLPHRTQRPVRKGNLLK